MASITNISNAWTAIGAPTPTAEVWQCGAGIVEISGEAAPGETDGIRLEVGQGVQVSVGKTIKYRKVGDGAAMIKREAL